MNPILSGVVKEQQIHSDYSCNPKDYVVKSSSIVPKKVTKLPNECDGFDELLKRTFTEQHVKYHNLFFKYYHQNRNLIG